MSETGPFAAGSVSLRLYPHNELDAPGVVRELCAQARLGLDGGFDGIMTSEHHGGVAGYLPNPFQMASFILEDTDAGWAAPCPLLLPLRPAAMVAEEVAWLAARHPGRVGLGVGSGASELDFTEMGLKVEDASSLFKAALPKVVAMLRGADLGRLEGDRALQHCAEHPVPVTSAAVSLTAVRRAARVGAGILLEGMSTPGRLAELCAAYDTAGGTEPKIIIRRVWVGQASADLIAEQRRFYERQAQSARAFPEDQTLTDPDPVGLAERIHEVFTTSGADAVNLRLHLPGMAAGDIRDQIVRLAGEVVPALRGLMASGQRPAGTAPLPA